MTTAIGTRRFSVEEYHRMAEVGILKPGERVELLDGDIDREIKIPHYARAGIAETWLVDLALQQVEVYRDPAPLGYAATTVNQRGATLAPQAFPQAVVIVDQLLA